MLNGDNWLCHRNPNDKKNPNVEIIKTDIFTFLEDWVNLRPFGSGIMPFVPPLTSLRRVQKLLGFLSTSKINTNISLFSMHCKSNPYVVLTGNEYQSDPNVS